MESSVPPAEIFKAVERLSGGKLSRKQDLGLLIDVAYSAGKESLLADVSFHAKFVARTYRIMKRIGPGGEGYDRLSGEFTAGIERVRELTRSLLLSAGEADQHRFEQTYGALTPQALQDLLALCGDLSWYKNNLLEHRTLKHRVSSARSGPQVLWRFALLAFIFAFLAWQGAVLMRGILGLSLFEPGTLEFRPSLAPEVEREVFRVISVTAHVAIPAYAVAVITAIVVLWTTTLRLKEHGWLLLSAILLFLFVPVEIYTILLDIRFQEALAAGAPLQELRELVVARAAALRGVPLIAELCYLSIVVLAVFQPLRRPAR
jgi:hypothetical protein